MTDETSAHEFVTRDHAKLHGYVRNQLEYYRVPPARLGPDDVVQHALAEVLERWAAIRNPTGYLFTVARRVIYRAAREGGRFTGGPVPGTGPDEPGAGQIKPNKVVWTSAALTPLPDETALTHVTLQRLYAGLPVTQAAAVHLVDVDGASRKMTAEQLGVRPGTVSAHRARGLRALRRIALIGGLALLWLGLPAALVWLVVHVLHRTGTDKHLAWISHDALPIALSLAPAVFAMTRYAWNAIRARYAVMYLESGDIHIKLVIDGGISRGDGQDTTVVRDGSASASTTETN